MNVDAYSVLVATGILAGYAVIVLRARQAGLPRNEIEIGVLFAVGVGFPVSHVFEVLLYQPERLQQDGIVSLFQVWRGISSYGGFIGGTLGVGIFYGLIKKKRWWIEADVFIQGFVVGWVFGRLGCSIVGDHAGTLTDSFLAYPYADGARHNLGLYEFLYTLLILVPVQLYLHRRRSPPGSFVGVTCVLYGILRFGSDFLRASDLADPDPRYFHLTFAQYSSIGMLLFGAWVLAGVRAGTLRS